MLYFSHKLLVAFKNSSLVTETFFQTTHFLLNPAYPSPPPALKGGISLVGKCKHIRKFCSFADTNRQNSLCIRVRVPVCPTSFNAGDFSYFADNIMGGHALGLYVYNTIHSITLKVHLKVFLLRPLGCLQCCSRWHGYVLRRRTAWQFVQHRIYLNEGLLSLCPKLLIP